MNFLRLKLIGLFFLLLFSNIQVRAQALTGSKTVCASGCDYATVTLAVTDLNTKGVGTTGVTFNVSA